MVPRGGARREKEDAANGGGRAFAESRLKPQYYLTKSAIRCRFVDRFAGFRAPSRVSGQRFSTHGASLLSTGSRRARFPVFTGHMKALRLPARASPVAFLFRVRGPRDPPLFVLALAALPDGWRTHPGQGIWSAGRPFAGTLSPGRRRDLTGSQAIHSMPLPRSKTPAGPTIPHPDGVVDAAPALPTAKAPAIKISRLLTRLQHLLPTRGPRGSCALGRHHRAYPLASLARASTAERRIQDQSRALHSMAPFYGKPARGAASLTTRT